MRKGRESETKNVRGRLNLPSNVTTEDRNGSFHPEKYGINNKGETRAPKKTIEIKRMECRKWHLQAGTRCATSQDNNSHPSAFSPTPIRFQYFSLPIFSFFYSLRLSFHCSRTHTHRSNSCYILIFHFRAIVDNVVVVDVVILLRVLETSESQFGVSCM